MAEFLSPGVFRLTSPIRIESFGSVVGKKEGEGPLGKYFDEIIEDSHFGKETWEQAESRFQLEAVSLAIKKVGLTKEDIHLICSGDLINQCIGSTYGLRELGIPYLGIYGACSTMAEGIIISSLITLLPISLQQRDSSVFRFHMADSVLLLLSGPVLLPELL